MRFVVISDTHGLHEKIQLPKGDVLIHAGDATSRGHDHEISAFGQWFGRQDFAYKIFVAGNHDFLFQTNQKEALLALKSLDEKIIYLQDSSFLLPFENTAIKIWGSPWQPFFFDWAFNLRNHELEKAWQKIPQDTQILITHGPPRGVLDLVERGEAVGCQHLRTKVLELSPKIHIFGHIHEGYGKTHLKNTFMINASSLNVAYEPVNRPIVFDWPLPA